MIEKPSDPPENASRAPIKPESQKSCPFQSQVHSSAKFREGAKNDDKNGSLPTLVKRIGEHEFNLPRLEFQMRVG